MYEASGTRESTTIPAVISRMLSKICADFSQTLLVQFCLCQRRTCFFSKYMVIKLAMSKQNKSLDSLLHCQLDTQVTLGHLLNWFYLLNSFKINKMHYTDNIWHDIQYLDTSNSLFTKIWDSRSTLVLMKIKFIA